MSDEITLHALSRNIVSLIGSCQVITSVYSVVKELVENSLDADASTVDVKLDDYGLEKIEVCDNGSGVKDADVPFMAKKHFTSKISSSEDLNFLTTYGFRGEALGSLCTVSHMRITTKTAKDPLSFVYSIGMEGDVVDKKPSHNGKGTIISCKNLFHNIPVRKQYYSGSQRKKDDLKKIEHLLMMYAIVKPDLRLTLKHGKDLVFQKTALKDVKTALHSVLGRQIANQMLYKEKCSEELKIKVEAFLPKPGSDIKDMSLVSAEKTFIAVNKRPVFVPELNKVLRNYYSNCHGLDSHRYPVCFVSLDIATNQIDVNVDPNKTKVFFQQRADIIASLEEMLAEIYGLLDNVPSWHYREANGDGVETSKETTKPQTEQKKPIRSFIAYSKRPGDPEATDEDKAGESLLTKEIDIDGQQTANKATSLPSFSLTFHSESSDQTSSDSHNKTSATPRVEILDRNAPNLTTDGSISSNKCLSDTNSCISKNKDSQGASSSEISRNENNTLQEDNTNSIDSDLAVLTNGCGAISKDKEGSSSLFVNKVQEGTAVEDFKSNDKGIKQSHVSSSDTDVKEKLTDNNKTVDDAELILHSLNKSDSNGATNKKSKDSDDELLALDVDTINWSKGNIVVGSTILQPVKLLPPSGSHKPGKRPPSPSVIEASQPRRKTAKLNILSNQATLFDMMSTQKIKKPDSPFTHFSNEKNSSLSKEFPHENSTEIERRLREEWDNLSNDERVAYREKCWHDTKRYEKDKVSINSQCEVRSTSGQDAKLVKKQPEKLKKVLKKRLYCKRHTIKVPMNSIRNASKEDTSCNTEEELKIIGPAQKFEDVWFFSMNNKLYLVNVWRLSEVSLYKKLKAEHKLPIKPCDPVTLNSRLISEQGLFALKTLATKCQSNSTYFHITDKRILANGFDVKCHCDPDGNLTCELVGMCGLIPAYDVKDLNLILGTIQSDHESSLSKTRTLKAAYYLQGEAVRMARQSAPKRIPQEVQTLLKGAMENVNQPCLHHKPIFKELLDFSNGDLDFDE